MGACQKTIEKIVIVQIKLSRSAYHDLDRGYLFYESQRQGLGTYFQESLFSDIDSLKIYAGVHATYFGKYRLLSKRFPYAIYYTFESDLIIVSAILDCRKNPEWIKEKFK